MSQSNPVAKNKQMKTMEFDLNYILKTVSSEAG